MYRVLPAIFFLLLSAPAGAQHATDTFHLYFDINITTLNPATEKRIDLLVYNDKIINGSSVMIIGYADFLGSEKHNEALSIERAKNVKNYLVKYGINAEYIKLCVGKGEVHRAGPRTREGYPGDRRVDIVVNNMRESGEKFRIASRPRRDTSHISRPAISSNLDDVKYLKAGATLRLRNVYFPADRHVILPESKETLDRLLQVLKDNPNIKISIEGHVCCVKDVPDALDIDTYEPLLSVNRARAIYDFLVSHGISGGRLKYAGYGRSRPVVPVEQSEEDAEKNRRVEIRVIENK